MRHPGYKIFIAKSAQINILIDVFEDFNMKKKFLNEFVPFNMKVLYKKLNKKKQNVRNSICYFRSNIFSLFHSLYQLSIIVLFQ